MQGTGATGLRPAALRAQRPGPAGARPGPDPERGDYVGPRARLELIDASIRRGDFPSQGTLAQLCGVSLRTMRRDLDYLRFNMGCPLEYDAARKGWFYAQPGRFLPAAFASRDDLHALLITAELVTAYEGTPLGPRMQAAFERALQALHLFPGEDARSLRRLSQRICFPHGPVSPVAPEVWQAVFRALTNERRLRLKYRKHGQSATVERDFDPWGIVVRGRDWFLHGYCHRRKQPLTLFLPSVTEAAILEDVPARVPAKFDVRQYAADGFRGLQSRARREKVVLRFDHETADLVERAPFADRQQVTKDRDGRVRVTFHTNALFEVEREVLRWGEHVEVLAPPKLRERMRRVVGALVGMYGRRR